MAYEDLVWLAIGGPMIALCLGYSIGWRHSNDYWADHADNGDVHHRGIFYRVRRSPGQYSRKERGHG